MIIRILGWKGKAERKSKFWRQGNLRQSRRLNELETACGGCFFNRFLHFAMLCIASVEMRERKPPIRGSEALNDKEAACL